MLRKIMKKCKKNYTNIILFLTFMLLWKYYRHRGWRSLLLKEWNLWSNISTSSLHKWKLCSETMQKIFLQTKKRVQLEQKQFFALVEVCSFSIAQARKLSWPNFALLFPLSSTWPLIWGGVHTLARLKKRKNASISII